MPGSTICSLDSTNVMEDIQILPSLDSMVDIPSHTRRRKRIHHHWNQPKNNRIHNTLFRRDQNIQRHVSTTTTRPPPLPLSSDATLDEINRKIQRLSVSIASGADSAEKWNDFCSNTGGVSSLLHCIRCASRELEECSRLGGGQGMQEGARTSPTRKHFRDREGVGRMEKQQEAFAKVSATCKVLRNVCSRDSNWAAMITDDILRADQSLRSTLDESGQTFHPNIIEDLLKVLNSIKEVDIFFSRKLSRTARRNLRNTGFSIKRFGTRRQRLGEFIIARMLLIHHTSHTRKLDVKRREENALCMFCNFC